MVPLKSGPVNKHVFKVSLPLARNEGRSPCEIPERQPLWMKPGKPILPVRNWVGIDDLASWNPACNRGPICLDSWGKLPKEPCILESQASIL